MAVAAPTAADRLTAAAAPVAACALASQSSGGGVSEQRRSLRFEYRFQRKFITSRIGLIRLLRELFTPAPILLINRQVRMNSLENPDPQSLEFGRLVQPVRSLCISVLQYITKFSV